MTNPRTSNTSRKARGTTSSTPRSTGTTFHAPTSSNTSRDSSLERPKHPDGSYQQAKDKAKNKSIPNETDKKIVEDTYGASSQKENKKETKGKEAAKTSDHVNKEKENAEH